MQELDFRDWSKHDPFYLREQQRYPEPLPSREYLLQVLSQLGKPINQDELIAAFGLNANEQEKLQHRLKAMVSAGQLVLNRRHKLGVPEKMNLESGQVIAHPEGYGFFVVDSGGEDGFIPPKYMQELMHGDYILARINRVDRSGRRNFAPVKVLQRANRRIVGRLELNHGLYSLIPDNRRLTHQILIPADQLHGAGPQQIVIAEITAYPTEHHQPIGKVVAVLGKEMAPGMEVQIAIENHDIPHEWPKEVQRQVAEIPEKISDQEYAERLDLRHLPFITIDGISARDFDDAVYCEQRGELFRLWVAIADVSHYVPIDSPLDQEALQRGTSVYFPDRVIPMLPEKLSNGICSLLPNADRLVLVCEMSINANGEMVRSKFHSAIIHSHARFTYETIEKILFDNDESLAQEFRSLLPDLRCLQRIYQVFAKARDARHTLEFDFVEPAFVYNSEGKIEAIYPEKRLQSHKIIEECMIAANVAAARFIRRYSIPALFRDHEGPQGERLEKLRQFVHKNGLTWYGKPDDVSPAQLEKLLKQARQRPDFHLVERMVLRSMSQAVYQPQSDGHFGLALQNYAHFTSPIRRYPDLLVHRAIHHVLQNGSAENYHYSMINMQELGKRCSIAERRADDATRDALDFLKCEFMSRRLGEEFIGRISNITSFGFFVTLSEYFIDGLVHISSLKGDYYHFDSQIMTLRGEHSGTLFSLMDEVRVRLVKADVEERKIDFQLIGHYPMQKQNSGHRYDPEQENLKKDKRKKKNKVKKKKKHNKNDKTLKTAEKKKRP